MLNKIGILNLQGCKKVNDKYININNTLQRQFPNDYFTKDELLPFKKYKFGMNYYNVPNYSIDYLDRTYLNCETIGKIGMNHKTNKFPKGDYFWLYGIFDTKIKKYYVIKTNNIKKNNSLLRSIYNKINNKYILLIITPEKEELLKQNYYLYDNFVNNI